jgi:hypothetical protein
VISPRDDESLSPELRDAAEAYHRPPETPREEIWARVQMGRRANEPQSRPALRLPGPSVHRWRMPAAIAAAVALAFGLGRVSTRPETQWGADAPIAAAAGRGSAVAFRVAAVEHLGQAESFLTLFRASVRSGAQQQGTAYPAARQLLATNRLLLDSPASADPRLRLLLEDLELVLAGIAQISPGRGSEDLDLITNDLERSAVLLRLRAAVPAGGAVPARPGAL